MNSSNIVLGVLSVCRVNFRNPTQIRASKFKGYREMCWVCWVYARARVRTHFSHSHLSLRH